jgi:hypothetical protein
MYTGVHVKCPSLCSNVNYTWIFQTDLCNIVEFKVHKNPSSGNQVVLCRRKDRRANGQTDTHYKFNIRLSKIYERCYKQRRNWVARVKTEKLGSECWTGVRELRFLITCHRSQHAVCIYIFNCVQLSSWIAWSLYKCQYLEPKRP